MNEKKDRICGDTDCVESFTSIKGGTGKTNIVILLANSLATAGKKVVLIDTDLNNSLSFHFTEKK